jgi:hypothetical protein
MGEGGTILVGAVVATDPNSVAQHPLVTEPDRKELLDVQNSGK